VQLPVSHIGTIALSPSLEGKRRIDPKAAGLPILGDRHAACCQPCLVLHDSTARSSEFITPIYSGELFGLGQRFERAILLRDFWSENRAIACEHDSTLAGQATALQAAAGPQAPPSSGGINQRHFRRSGMHFGMPPEQRA
jgi:hypothetical protein